MKLRNKKTGKIIEYSISLNQWSEDDQEWYLFGNYDSIDELKEEWEDYAKKEPIIKDPKVRKAVKAWANANDFKYVNVGYGCVSEANRGNIQIHFDDSNIVEPEYMGIHTIDELCGEEE